MSSERRVTEDDYGLIRARLTDLVSGLKQGRRKAMYGLLDVDAAMDFITRCDHAYIVADSFLVLFALAVPWYSTGTVLQELLVLRLTGCASFDEVPRFLMDSARRAGAKIVGVGTALARSDRALARLYAKHGFAEAARTLVKEI